MKRGRLRDRLSRGREPASGDHADRENAESSAQASPTSGDGFVYSYRNTSTPDSLSQRLRSEREPDVEQGDGSPAESAAPRPETPRAGPQAVPVTGTAPQESGPSADSRSARKSTPPPGADAPSSATLRASGPRPASEIADGYADDVHEKPGRTASGPGGGRKTRRQSGGASKLHQEPEAGTVASDGQMQALPRVMAIANQKGGVGKTTTAVNLGAALADLGYRVLVIDLDPQGNATTGLGLDGRTFDSSMYDVIMRDVALEDVVEPTSVRNLFVAPATIDLAGAEIELVPAFSRELKLRRAVESVAEEFQYVLIDCPPSLGLITVNGLAAAREVLVPIQCEYYALEGLSQLLRNVSLVASNLNPSLEVSTIVLTMYDARTKLAEQVAGEVREHFGVAVCKSVIPRTVRLSEAPSFGQPITVFDPSSRGAIAYRELAKEVSGGPSKRSG